MKQYEFDLKRMALYKSGIRAAFKIDKNNGLNYKDMFNILHNEMDNLTLVGLEYTLQNAMGYYYYS